jgi:hypothetical protein
MTERGKVGFESKSPIISRCKACHAPRNAGFGGCAGEEMRAFRANFADDLRAMDISISGINDNHSGLDILC